MINKQNGRKIENPNIEFTLLMPILNNTITVSEQEISEVQVIKLKKQLPTDGLSTILNRGIRIVSNEWILLTTHPLLFRSNFFETAREDIEALIDAYQNTSFVLIGQTLQEKEKHEMWKNYIHGYQARFHFTKGPIRVPFLIVNRRFLQAINGLDERYDSGSGFHIENLILRLSIIGLPTILDQYLMAYSFKDDEVITSILTNSLLWEYDKYEILNGKYLAYNTTKL